MSVYEAYDLITELLKSTDSRIRGAFDKSPVITEEALYMLQVHNAIQLTIPYKKESDRKKAMISLKNQNKQTKKDKFTATPDEMRKKFAHVKIKGYDLDIVTGEMTPKE